MFTGTSELKISTKVRADAQPQITIVTIDWDGYTPDMAMSDLLSGTSPRVAIQARLREDGIPSTLTIKATEFHAKRARVARDMTLDEIAAGAKSGKYDAAELIKVLTEAQANR